MTITTVCGRIALLGLEIEGITATADPPPTQIDTANMPHLHIWAGRAQDDVLGLGDSGFIEIRQYRIQIAVAPSGQNVRAEVETECRTVLQAVKDFFRARPNLENLEWVQNVRVVGDSGVIFLPEYQLSLIGFEIYLEVTEYVEKTFTDY